MDCRTDQVMTPTDVTWANVWGRRKGSVMTVKVTLEFRSLSP